MLGIVVAEEEGADVVGAVVLAGSCAPADASFFGGWTLSCREASVNLGSRSGLMC